MNSATQIKDELNNLLYKLGDYDYSNTWGEMGSSLFNGFPGISLFMYHLYLYTSDEKYYNKSFQLFEKGFNHLQPIDLSFSHGATGVMWLLNYYKQQKAFDVPFNDLLNQFDNLLLQKINEDNSYIDPMHGLLSIANYLFSRGTPLSQTLLLKILDVLDKNKMVVDQGITWKTMPLKPEDVNMVPHFNFGYAHGIGAILYFLALYIHHGIEVAKCSWLFDKALAFFLSFEDPEDNTLFPSLAYDPDPAKRDYKKSYRIAYCYGDLGIASGLMAAGKLMNNTRVLDIAHRIATRIAPIAIQVIDGIDEPGLCHGAAGNGYMFFNLFCTFGDVIYKDAALLQYKKLLDLRREDTGVCGYSSLDYDHQQKKFFQKKDAGFINGTSGAGLSIISFLTNNQINGWNKILLLS